MIRQQLIDPDHISQRQESGKADEGVSAPICTVCGKRKHATSGVGPMCLGCKGDTSPPDMRQIKVCDSCLTAAYDEGTGDVGFLRAICTDMGADIADHLCDAREEPGTGPCACACNS